MRAAHDDEDEGRRERDQRGKQAAAQPVGRVADHGDRLDHRPRRDLAERDSAEELRAGHPVIRDHRVVLHQRDDHETAAVGERADLERDPGDCAQPGGRGHRHREQGQRRQPLARRRGRVRPGPVRAPGGHLDQAAGQQDEDQERAEPGARSSARHQVGQPPPPGRPLLTSPLPAGRQQADGGADRDGGHRRARPGRRAEDPGRQVARQEQGREAQDDDQAGNDEAGAAQQGPGQPAQPPGTEDRQLRGGRAGEQVGGGDPVFELAVRQPGAVLDAELAEQGDMRGRPAEADDSDAGPFARDGGQADPRGGLLGHGLAGAGAAGMSSARAVWITGQPYWAAPHRACRARHQAQQAQPVPDPLRSSAELSAAKGVPA